MNNDHLTETRFSNLELSDAILRSLKEAGFNHCTPIQDKTPTFSSTGQGCGRTKHKTGTGKTAAFLLATFQYLLKEEEFDDMGNGIEIDEDDIEEIPEKVIAKPERPRTINYPRAIILAPTRELAIQIHKDALLLSKRLNLSFALVYGGTDYQKQLAKVKANVDIIIGTPGRIIDFYKQNVFTLNHIEVMVLDEADRMFDLGFIKDIRYLLRRMPSPGSAP